MLPFSMFSAGKDVKLMKKLEPLRPKRKLELEDREASDEDSLKEQRRHIRLPTLEPRRSSCVSDISDPMPMPTIDTGDAAASDDDTLCQPEIPAVLGRSWPLSSQKTTPTWSEENYRSHTKVILQQNKATLQTIMIDLKELAMSKQLDPVKTKTIAKLIEDHVSIIQALKESIDA
jgi:hypothetical protein